jgi:hypothetical protein
MILEDIAKQYGVIELSHETCQPRSRLFLVYNQFMIELGPLEPVDYLVVGHLTEDLTPSGPRL